MVSLSQPGICGAIGEHRLHGGHGDRAEQGDGLARRPLPRGQGEAERVAEAVRETVQLAGESAP